MFPGKCTYAELADNTKGRVIIFAHYWEKIQMNAVLSQGDDQVFLIPAVKVKQKQLK